ncbi:hypothetical protein [Yersinia enterocolitica]|uniref:hypothetical protein n=1 Tax=Yersinia enterocolitica TaxID=630 RepID=UPI0029A0E566|nr:hypothetical protein [Yersinia enterocolitica]
MSTLLTTQSIWGYISHAAAKSAVGIETPEFQPRQYDTPRACFLLSQGTHTSQWWGVQGSRKARRLVDPVVSTLYVSPPDD